MIDAIKNLLGFALQFAGACCVVAALATAMIRLRTQTEPAAASEPACSEPVYEVVPAIDGNSYLAIQRNGVVVAGDALAAGSLFDVDLSGARPCRMARVPGSSNLVLGCLGGEVVLTDVQLSTRARHLGTLPNSITSIDMAPGGNAVTASSYGTVGVWDLQSGDAKTWRVAGEYQVARVQFSGKGDALLVSTFLGSVAVWDFREKRLLREFVCDVDCLSEMTAVSGTNICLFTGTSDGNKQVEARNVDTGECLWKTPVPGTEFLEPMPDALATSPDGKRVAFGCGSRLALFDLQTGRLLLQVAAKGHEVTSLSYVPGGRQLLSSGNDGSIRSWDAQTLEEIWTIVTVSAEDPTSEEP